MTFKVVQKVENPLMKRKEVVLEIVSESAPSYKSIEEFVSKEFSTSLELIKIKKVVGEFGKKIFKAIVNIYSSRIAMDSAESKTKKERESDRKAVEEAKKLEEAPTTGDVN
jgi:ribosomal protein S24E